MLVNVPLRLLRYSARQRSAAARRPVLAVDSRMSGQPSPSTSKNAQPEPIVSGRHFFPARPLLCVNLMPGLGGDIGELDGSIGHAAAQRPLQQRQGSLIARPRGHAFVSWIICRSLLSSGLSMPPLRRDRLRRFVGLERRKSFSSRAAFAVSPRPR